MWFAWKDILGNRSVLQTFAMQWFVGSWNYTFEVRLSVCLNICLQDTQVTCSLQWRKIEVIVWVRGGLYTRWRWNCQTYRRRWSLSKTGTTTRLCINWWTYYETSLSHLWLPMRSHRRCRRSRRYQRGQWWCQSSRTPGDERTRTYGRQFYDCRTRWTQGTNTLTSHRKRSY